MLAEYFLLESCRRLAVPPLKLKQRERENLLSALEATHWRISGPSGAAKLLGLRPTTLASKIKALGLREE